MSEKTEKRRSKLYLKNKQIIKKKKTLPRHIAPRRWAWNKIKKMFNYTKEHIAHVAWVCNILNESATLSYICTYKYNERITVGSTSNMPVAMKNNTPGYTDNNRHSCKLQTLAAKKKFTKTNKTS